jgi:hypothetical protein
MAHYAWINEDNIVVNVTLGVDENLIQEGFGGSTEAWESFYTDAVNQPGIYVKRTSYTGKIRYNYAGIGYTYDPIDDAFIAPQPYPSWVLNLKKQWEPPIAYPTDGKLYRWNEDTGEWHEAEAL